MDRNRLRIVRAFLASFILAAAAWSCSDGTGPGDPVLVQTAPNGEVDLEIGDTLTVRATVVNARQDVRYSTSNDRVATVSSNGVVTAIGEGNALITVTSEARSSAFATVEVRVGQKPSITILGLVNALGVRIDPDEVKGTVFVRLTVEKRSATALQVLVGGVVACERSLGSTFAAPVDIMAALSADVYECPLNTAQFDSTTATPKFANGSTTLSARLLGGEGTAVQTDPGFAIRLSNPNAILVRFVDSPSVLDAAGLKWITGPVEVTATPVLFGVDSPVQRVTFVYGFPGGPSQAVTDSQAPFRTVFPDSFPNPAALRNLVDPEFYINVLTATAAGAAGPEGQTGDERYDDAPPAPGTLVAREWVGAETPFANLYDKTGQSDRGVGVIRTVFYAGDRSLSTEDVIARGKLVETGNDLEQRPRDSYRLAARVCDVLNNCVAIPGFTFGVDRTAPRIESVSVPNRAINPTGNLVLQLEDDLSGLSAQPIEAAVRALDNPICGPLVDGIDFPGFGDANNCRAEPFGTSLGIPHTTSGYYVYTLTPQDRAGNRGRVVVDTILVDRVAPQVISVSPPSQVTAGEEGSFTAAATDDLDLTRIVFRLVYPASGGNPSIALPFTDVDSVGVAFDAQLTRNASRTTRFPFVRTLGSGSGTTRTTVLVDSVQVQAIDAAGQSSTFVRHLPSVIFGNTTTNDPFSGVSTTRATVASAERVCVANCGTDGRQSVKLEMNITATSDFLTRPPFARVYFFRRDGSGNVFLLGSMSTIGSNGDIGGGVALWNFPFTYSPPATLEGRFNIFAVGVNSAGQALRNEGTDVEFFIGRQSPTPSRSPRPRS